MVILNGLRLCVYICVCINIHIYMCIYTHSQTHIHIFTYTHVHVENLPGPLANSLWRDNIVSVCKTKSIQNNYFLLVFSQELESISGFIGRISKI